MMRHFPRNLAKIDKRFRFCDQLKELRAAAQVKSLHRELTRVTYSEILSELELQTMQRRLHGEAEVSLFQLNFSLHRYLGSRVP